MCHGQRVVTSVLCATQIDYVEHLEQSRIEKGTIFIGSLHIPVGWMGWMMDDGTECHRSPELPPPRTERAPSSHPPGVPVANK